MCLSILRDLLIGAKVVAHLLSSSDTRGRAGFDSNQSMNPALDEHTSGKGTSCFTAWLNTIGYVSFTLNQKSNPGSWTNSIF